MANLIQLPSPLDPESSKLLLALRAKITQGLPHEQHLNAALKYGMMYKLNYEKLLTESKPTNTLHTNLEIQRYKEKLAELKLQIDGNRKMANEFQYMKEIYTNAKANLKSLNLTMEDYRTRISELQNHIITLKASKIPLPAPIFIMKAKAEEKKIVEEKKDPDPDSQTASVPNLLVAVEPESKTDTPTVTSKEFQGVLDALSKLDEEVRRRIAPEDIEKPFSDISSSFDEQKHKLKKMEDKFDPLLQKVSEIEEQYKYLTHRDELNKAEFFRLKGYHEDFDAGNSVKLSKLKDKLSKIEEDQKKVDKNLIYVDLFNEHLKTLMTYHELDKIIEKSKKTEDVYSDQYEKAIKKDTDRLAVIIRESEEKLRTINFAEQQLKLAFAGIGDLAKKSEKSRTSKKSGLAERRQNVATQHYVDVLRIAREEEEDVRVLRRESRIQEVTNILLSSDWKKCVSERYTESLLLEWAKKPFLSPVERKPYTDQMTMEQWDWQKNVNWRLHYKVSVVARG